MSSITNFCSSAIDYAKSTAGLCAKATATFAATSVLAKVLRATGLHSPIAAIASKFIFKLSTFPLALPCDVFAIFVKNIIPTPYYYSEFWGHDDCQRNDSYRIQCPLISPALLTGIPEEFMYRGLLQQKIFPWYANKLPSPLGNILNNKITRIFLTSLTFAAAHGSNFSSHFATGVCFGIAAEASQSLKIPILAHTMHNGLLLFLGARGDLQTIDLLFE